jgi:CDP-6-deoxy-D-xylo-4-hexulose-3-dehydrase
MQAACGLAQLAKVPGFIQTRKNNFKFLKERLTKSQDHLILPIATTNSDPSWFGFPITIKTSAPVDRVKILSYLDQNKIGTRLLFGGNLTRQPYMIGRNYRVCSDLKQTDTVMKNTFWIGLYPALTTDMLEFVVSKIEAVLGTDN